MYYIYRITNLINGKTYIGQHKYKDLNEYYMGSGKHLIRAQKKYGIENFKKEILVFNIPKEEQANILEKTFISSEREKVGRENCYNIADGGQGVSGLKHSEESKKKMSEAHKSMSEETKKKISKAHKGKTLSEEHKKKLGEVSKGRPCSEATKNKISETLKGHHVSEETKRKLSDKYRGKHWKLADGKRVWY